jgi:hypothetical protein
MKRIASVVMALALVSALASWSLAAELSAEVLHSMQGQQVVSKVFLKGDKVRMEGGQAAQPGQAGQAGQASQAEEVYQIIRQDKGVMWMVNTQQRAYYEAPLGQMRDLSQAGKTAEKLPGETSRQDLGAEKIDGRSTRKLEITYTHQGQTQTVLMWYAKDLGLPLKTAAKDGSWSVEYKKVVTAPQADSLFEIPAGYQKMAMPAYQQQGGYPQQ